MPVCPQCLETSEVCIHVPDRMSAMNSISDKIYFCPGGFGIVVGLATFGYKILKVLGVDAVRISNSRGFSAELGTAITVVLASRLGASTALHTGFLFPLPHP